MSANFWLSSHGNHWLFDRQQLYQNRAQDLKYATEQELGWIGIFSANVITRLAKKLNLRQQCVASAIVFFRRFYTRNSYCDTDPCLVAATCVYVAAKVEEQPVHVKSVVTEGRNVFHEISYTQFTTDHHKLAEMEFYLIEDIDFHLVVHHPYKALLQMCGRDSSKLPGMLDIDESTFQMAWFVINDTFRSHLCLLHPPHVVAVAAVYIAFAINPPPPKKQPQPQSQVQAKLKQQQQQQQQQQQTTASAPSPSSSTDPSSASASKSNPPSAAPSPTPNSTSTPALPARPAESASNPKLLHPSLPARPNFDAFPSASNNNSGRTSPRPSSTANNNPAKTSTPITSAFPAQASPFQNPSAPAQATAPPPPPPPAKRDPVTFLAELNVPMSIVLEIIQEIISLYSLWYPLDYGPVAAASSSPSGPAASTSSGAGGRQSPAGPAHGQGPSATLAAQMLTGHAHGSLSHRPPPQPGLDQRGLAGMSSNASTPRGGAGGGSTSKFESDERVVKILGRIRDARAMDPSASRLGASSSSSSTSGIKK